MLLRDLNHTRLTGDRYQGGMVDLMLTELDDERGYKRGLNRLFDSYDNPRTRSKLGRQ